MADALGTPGSVVSALDHRLDQGGMIAVQGPTALDIRTGVLVGPGSTTLVTGTSATGTMTYAIAVHHWVSSRATADGVYQGATEAVQTVPTTPAPGANSRIDVIWERQRDQFSAFTPDATTAPEWGVTQGTAAVSPVKPTIPVGALELAVATVAAGATSTDGSGVTITNTARPTVARGAPIPCRNQAERDELITTPRAGYPGLHVTRLDLGGVIQRWVSGTTWESYVSASDIAETTGTLTPAAGWSAEPNYYAPSYHLSADGKVTLRGRLLRTGAAVSLASAPSILTLPAAIRPASAISPDSYVGIGGPPALAYMARLTCASPFTTMTVSDLAGSGGTFNQNSGYVHLDGVSWWL